MVIAIDGYSGTGKSSTARIVAERLGYAYIDSGAMYRAVTFYLVKNQIDFKQSNAISDALSFIEISFELVDDYTGFVMKLNGDRVGEEIRSPAIAEKVSEVAAIPEVRKKLVAIQRTIAEKRDVVMDGRDIGTVVFPHADLKIFMTANVDVRAQRRYNELKEKGITAELLQVKTNLIERDRIDTTRADSPLIKAMDAIEIDTTNLTFEEQVNQIVELAKKKKYAN